MNICHQIRAWITYGSLRRLGVCIQFPWARSLLDLLRISVADLNFLKVLPPWEAWLGLRNCRLSVNSTLVSDNYSLCVGY